MFEIFGVDDDTFEPSIDRVLEFVHPDDVEALRARIQRWHASRCEVRHTYRITRRDGEVRQLETRAWQHTDKDGEMTSVLGTTRDITARRAASQLLQTSLQEVQALSGQRGALLRDLAAAEERERLRIAADLHDDTIQSLDAIRLTLERAQSETADEAVLGTLADAENQVRRIGERLRQLMFELMPPIAECDLQTAVESYCAVVLVDGPLAYEVSGGPHGLAGDKHLLAYRLVQEAIRNALKHSRGTRLRIAFEVAADELVATVSDDGVGLPGGPETEPTHGGIRIMRQRAQAAGGATVFGPGLGGHGLSVAFHLPVEWTDTQ
jgi:signal transduction histidine kinase